MRLIGMRNWYVPALSLVLLAACASEPASDQSSESARSSVPVQTSAASVPSSAPARPSAPGGPSAPGRPSQPALPSGAAWPAPVTSGPPRDPTDAIKKTDIVVGTVTRGGSGPCFGVQTDDGIEYALYSSKPLTLTRGQYVRLRTEAGKLRIDCGSGRFRAITAVEPVS